MNIKSIVEFRNMIGKEIDNSMSNNYKDNWDYTIFGEYKEVITLKSRLKPIAMTLIPKKIYYNLVINKYLGKHLDGFLYLYNHLSDITSRNLLLKILTYKVLGHKKIKLPLSTAEYWENLKKIEELTTDNKEIIEIPFKNMKLRKYDLISLGYPVQLFFVPFGIMADFITKQYIYEQDNVVIKAEENDIVIDAGACWGDTALFFSDAVGVNGKVYSFEFVPSNLEILKRNLDLNPSLKSNIELVEHPIWNLSNQDVYYTNSGPGSIVSMKEFDNYFGKTKTLSIDDLVKERNIPTVDFIKMDIEGAEPFAMDGARETIIKHKPKLAISIYHSNVHFYSILKFIQSLNLNYKFYLKHASIHASETILFAKIENIKQ